MLTHPEQDFREAGRLCGHFKAISIKRALSIKKINDNESLMLHLGADG
jgi:hypothetical protein